MGDNINVAMVMKKPYLIIQRAVPNHDSTSGSFILLPERKLFNMRKFYAVLFVVTVCCVGFTWSSNDETCSKCQLGVSTVKRVANKALVDNVMLSEVDKLVKASCPVGNLDMCSDVTRAVLQQIVYVRDV